MTGSTDQADRGGHERGSGTLLICAVLTAVVALVAVATVAVGWLSCRHRAAQVADLSALAGAHAMARGDDACARAREVAQRNAASLSQCSVQGAPPSFVVTVTVAVDLTPHLTAGPHAVQMTSLAGTG